jgi:hypothetical protein
MSDLHDGKMIALWWGKADQAVVKAALTDL